MSAIVERLDERLKTLPPQRAATVERLIEDLLNLVQPVDAAIADDHEMILREDAKEALARIVARGGIAGIEDAGAWQREQRAEKRLPGRDA